MDSKKVKTLTWQILKQIYDSKQHVSQQKVNIQNNGWPELKHNVYLCNNYVAENFKKSYRKVEQYLRK